MDNTWRYDDGFHLFYAVKYSPLQYFFNPEITVLHTQSNVTPFNPFFYDITMTFFGLNIFSYYFHLLFILTLASISSFILFRQWFDEITSFFAVSFFVLGGPTAYVTQTLMTGHYVYGLLFAVWALYFYSKALKCNSLNFSILSGIFYLLAVTCKEIYVPLIIVFIFFPDKKVIFRLKYVCPHILVAIFYVFWRRAVLGSFIGGYSEGNSDLLNNIYLSIKSYPKVFVSLFGEYIISPYIIYAMLGLFLFFIFKSKLRFALFYFICLLVVILPTLPVAYKAVYQERFYFLLWWITSLLLVIIFRKIFAKNIFLIFMALFFILFLFNNYKTQTIVNKHTYEHDLYTKFVIENYRNDNLALYTRDNYDFLLILLRDAYFKYFDLSSDFQITNNFAELQNIRKTHTFYSYDHFVSNLKNVDSEFLNTLRNNFNLTKFKNALFENKIYVKDVKVTSEIKKNGNLYTFKTYFHYNGKKNLHRKYSLNIPPVYFNSIINDMKYTYIPLTDNNRNLALKAPLSYKRINKLLYISNTTSIDPSASFKIVDNLSFAHDYNFKCNIEEPASKKNIINARKKYMSIFSGWAVLDNRKKQSMDIFLYLKPFDNSPDKSYLIKAFRTVRPDIVSHFANKKYFYSGFYTASAFNNISKGTYEASIVQKFRGKYYQCKSNRTIRIQ